MAIGTAHLWFKFLGHVTPKRVELVQEIGEFSLFFCPVTKEPKRRGQAKARALLHFVRLAIQRR